MSHNTLQINLIMPPKRKAAAKKKAPTLEKGGDKKPKAQEFGEDDIARFKKKFSPSVPDECLVAIRRRGSNRLKQCRGGMHPIFSQVWCVEVTEGIPAPGRQAPSLSHQQYAKSLGMTSLYQLTCDECLDHNKGLWNTSKNNRLATKAAAKAEGKRQCDTVYCWESDSSQFDTATSNYCKKCMEVNRKKHKRLVARKENAASEGTQYCITCNSYPDVAMFQRRYRNLVTGEIKTVPTKRCVSCLDAIYEIGAGRNYVKECRREIKREKLETLELNQKTLNCNGCCRNCPHNLKRLKKQLCDLLGPEEGERVFIHNLHWDHRNPLTKTRNCADICNKEERLKEIAKCDLLCVFCHRLKTYINGDTILGRREVSSNKASVTRVTRLRLSSYLRMKLRRLREQETRGRCPGYNDGAPCPFHDDFSVYQELAVKVGVDENFLKMMMHDFDHLDPALKLGSVLEFGWEEALKCLVKCCFCHGIKTANLRETVRWVSLRAGSEEECGPASSAEVEGEDEEREDGEWRVQNF